MVINKFVIYNFISYISYILLYHIFYHLKVLHIRVKQMHTVNMVREVINITPADPLVQLLVSRDNFHHKIAIFTLRMDQKEKRE